MKNANLYNALHKIAASFTGLTAAFSATIVAFALPQLTHAQEGSAGALLEEIVTVARKRSEAEAVQDVPVAMTAFGAAQIEALFVRKLDDLSYLMPNVQLEAVGTFPGVQNFSIRGQGINSSIPSVDPTVGVFVDGVYMGTTYGVVVDTFDLERVEVLRGPQGLLFGRNVTGGAVMLRNARPDGEFGARVRVSQTDEEQTNIAAAIEGSLVEDRLAGKLVVYYDKDNGYFDNINQTLPAGPGAVMRAPHIFQPVYFEPALRSQVGEFETTILRPMLVWTPNDSTDITLILESGKSEGDGATWANVTDQRSGALAEYATTADEIGFTDMEWYQSTIELNVDAFGGTITNIFGYREVDADSVTDIDGTFLPIFSAGGFTNQEQISNELRWSGRFTQNWESTIGIYYFDQDIEYGEDRYIWLPPPDLGPPPTGLNITRALGGDMTGENFGVFWNNDFFVGDSWVLSAGIRYTDESKTARIINSPPTDPCEVGDTTDCIFEDLQGDWDNITPKLGVQWNFSDNGHIYGYWSKGFRSGGFNFRNARPDFIPPGPTREEESNTIEIGLKTDLADGRVRLNIAAFHNEITDIQRELNLPDPSVIVLQATINAGDVTIQGIEMDFVALLTENFSINASVGVQDGEYDSIDPFVTNLEALLEVVLGEPTTVIGPDLPRLAPSNYSVGFSWDLPTGDLGIFNLASSYSYREGHPYNDSNTENFDDQNRWDASVNWYSPGDQWHVSLYGRNLTDEANWGNLTSIAGLWTAGPMQKGRYLGVEINWRY